MKLYQKRLAYHDASVYVFMQAVGNVSLTLITALCLLRDEYKYKKLIFLFVKLTSSSSWSWTSFPLVSTAATCISHFSFLSQFFLLSFHSFIFIFSCCFFYQNILSMNECTYPSFFSFPFSLSLVSFTTYSCNINDEIYAWFALVWLMMKSMIYRIMYTV